MYYFKLIVILVVIFTSCKVSTDQSLSISNLAQGFNMPVVKEPVFPDNTVRITDFGAVNDGQTLNTKAIADAINDVSEKGGGKVIIPRGIWLTGPIILKSNINLYTEEGALVIFSSDKNLYPLLETDFEGLNTVRCTSPISGRNLENIALTGKGVYDGTGEAWRPVKKEKLTESQWRAIVKSGGVLSEDGKIWYPSSSSLEGQKRSTMNVPDKLAGKNNYEEIKDFLRPVMVSLLKCKSILFDGPVFQNSPAWCIHPLMCENLIIRNVTVKNPWFSQNGDGLDIESCKNCLIYDSNFDVGDDAICLKSGKDKEGRKRGMPTENLIIRNCIVYHGHGGVTIGSEMSGGIRNVYVSGCTFLGTDVGLRFKSNRGRGGVVENLFFTDINMINIPTQAISFNLYYGGLAVSEMADEKGNNAKNEEIPAISEETPLFRNITIKNVTCKGAREALFLQGLPEQNLENIHFENIDIEADNGITCIDASGILINNMRLISKAPEVINLYNSSNIDIQKIDIPDNLAQYIKIKGNKSSKITIRSENLKKTVISHEVDSSAIRIL